MIRWKVSVQTYVGDELWIVMLVVVLRIQIEQLTVVYRSGLTMYCL